MQCKTTQTSTHSVLINQCKCDENCMVSTWDLKSLPVRDEEEIKTLTSLNSELLPDWVSVPTFNPAVNCLGRNWTETAGETPASRLLIFCSTVIGFDSLKVCLVLEKRNSGIFILSHIVTASVRLAYWQGGNIAGGYFIEVYQSQFQPCCYGLFLLHGQ